MMKAFTLIELLVVVAIIAVLSVVVILSLNPFSLLQQSRDSSRLSDAEVLNKALALYAADTGGVVGSASTTYVSIPDATATSTAGDQCQGVASTSLMVIAYNWTYHCASSSTYRNTNGTGWIPVNFGGISAGAPFGALPKDPVNAAATLGSSGYYTVAMNGSNQWAIAIPLESTKYLKQAALLDGGYDPGDYEIGTNLSFVAQEEGLVGWWAFDDV